MQFTPDDLVTEERISSIDAMSVEEVFTKVTGREEVNLHPHCHDRHQIIYILSGTLHVEVGGVSYFVTDRHLVWIPGGTLHRLSSNNRQITLLTSYVCLEHSHEEEFAIYRTDELIARNLKFISTFHSLSKWAEPEIFSFARSFFQVLPRICQKATFPTQLFILAKDSRLLPVLEYMKTNLHQDLTLEQVASHFGFSVRSLTRLFTSSGIRFVHYLNYQRVVRAIEILTDNVLNIEQTAYKVGFNSPNSFSRVFKQITGEAPSAYLRRQ